VAAYPSAKAFEREAKRDGAQRAQLGLILRHRFLTPTAPDPEHEQLKRAADLSRSDDFKKKRARFYKWQEEIIEKEIAPDRAVAELETHLTNYNECVAQAFRDTVSKYVLTVIPVAMGLTGALIAGGPLGVVTASARGLISLAKFWRFDRRPVIAAGDCDAAAMLHDARAHLRLED
jgi:hypothetical protein